MSEPGSGSSPDRSSLARRARYHCTHCGFELPFSWAGYTFVMDDEGRRIPCPAAGPKQFEAIREMTGLNYLEAWRAGRIGFRSHVVCMSCLGALVRQPNRDDETCPHCGSDDLKPVPALLGETCPRCGVGIITGRTPGEANGTGRDDRDGEGGGGVQGNGREEAG